MYSCHLPVDIQIQILNVLYLIKNKIWLRTPNPEMSIIYIYKNIHIYHSGLMLTPCIHNIIVVQIVIYTCLAIYTVNLSFQDSTENYKRLQQNLHKIVNIFLVLLSYHLSTCTEETLIQWKE